MIFILVKLFLINASSNLKMLLRSRLNFGVYNNQKVANDYYKYRLVVKFQLTSKHNEQNQKQSWEKGADVSSEVTKTLKTVI